MNRNQKGFSPVLLIVALLVLSGIGIVGWRAYYTSNNGGQNNSRTNSNVNDTDQKNEDKAEAKDSLKPGDIVELPERVMLNFKSDLSKLPTSVPQSFKDYMAGKLEANERSEECITTFTVSKISTVNIAGGAGSADKKTLQSGDGNCIGGARVIWSYADDTWVESGFQAMETCENLKKAKIYSEFEGVCYDTATESEAKNPNGSIRQMAE